MKRQCPACGKMVRVTGFLSKWHLCITEDEARKHGTYQQARDRGDVGAWVRRVNADIDASLKR